MRSLRTVSVSLLALACGALSAQPQTPAGQSRVVRYDLKMADLKYVFGAAPPVLRVRPGDVIETSTVDAEGKAQQAAGMKADGPNALTGPFYVEGAQPGDTLVVKFQTLDIEGKVGYGDAGPGFGALNSSDYTPMLGPGIPKKEWLYPIDKAANVATFRANDSNFTVKIPLHPFLGCVGVAPAAGEVRSSIVPAEFGGNMDARGECGQHAIPAGERSGRPAVSGRWPCRDGGWRNRGYGDRGFDEGSHSGRRHQGEGDPVAALRERELPDGGRDLPALG